jgi:hypothetical protein
MLIYLLITNRRKADAARFCFQLATYTQGSHTQSWSLDSVGNWTSFTNEGGTQTRSFNNPNQLTAMSGATTPTYDANGNTTQDDNGVQYTYDAWNRIV